MATQRKKAENRELSPEVIKAAFERLFAPGGKGVRRFPHSGLRHVRLAGGAELIEQNPEKHSRWAELARSGHRVAWVMRDGAYLARVIDGEVELLEGSDAT